MASKRFLTDSVTMGRDLKYPPFGEVVTLTLLAVVAIVCLMLVVATMDLSFHKLLIWRTTWFRR